MNTPAKFLRHVSFVVVASALTLSLGACASESPSVSSGPQFTVAVIGPDATGADVYYAEPASYPVEGTDAWTATRGSFDANSLAYDASNSEYGVLLNSITSPYDGKVLAFDEASGCFWQLFVDGVSSEVGIDGVEVKEGSEIVWYYSAFGDALPEAQLADAA